MKRHEKTCEGDNLKCEKCGKLFTTKQGIYKHKKNVNCQTTIVHQNNASNHVINNQTINITYNTINNVKQYISYNHEKQSLISNDPHAPSSQLLCYNGLKNEICKKSLEHINVSQFLDILQNIVDSENKNYDKLWRFLFRNIDNKNMQMFMLQKNNNATHANVFNEGNIEMINKNYLYKSLSVFVCKYILDLSFDYADIISLLKNDQQCKKSFFQIIKEESETFDYYKRWLI